MAVRMDNRERGTLAVPTGHRQLGTVPRPHFVGTIDIHNRQWQNIVLFTLCGTMLAESYFKSKAFFVGFNSCQHDSYVCQLFFSV